MSGVIAIDATGLDGVITVDVTVPGPQGPQGIQGPVGPSGPQGPVGPQGPTGAGVWVSDTPPALALVDDLWWDSTGTGLYVRYNDGNSTQWVVAENQNTVPEAPRDGATYGRMNGTWAGVLPASSGPFLPLSGGAVTGPTTVAALLSTTSSNIIMAGDLTAFNAIRLVPASPGSHAILSMQGPDATTYLDINTKNAGYVTVPRLNIGAPNAQGVTRNITTNPGANDLMIYGNFYYTGNNPTNGNQNFAQFIVHDNVSKTGSGMSNLLQTTQYTGANSTNCGGIWSQVTQEFAPTGKFGFMTAITAATSMSFNCGGTDFTDKTHVSGAATALNSYSSALSGATFLSGIVGYEMDIQAAAGSSLGNKIGLFIVLRPMDAVAGAWGLDTAISITSGTPTVSNGWDYLLGFGNPTTQIPYKPTATFLKSWDPQTPTNPALAAWGIDFFSTTFSGGFAKSQGFMVDGAGNVTAQRINTGGFAITPSGSTLTIDTAGQSASLVSIANGGSAFSVGDKVTTVNGGLYVVTAQTGGVATAVMQLVPDVAASPPANPVATTSTANFGGNYWHVTPTGLTLNLSWSSTTATVALQPSGGPTTVGGNLTTTGTLTGGTLAVTNNATVGGTLGVTGVSTLGTTNISGTTVAVASGTNTGLTLAATGTGRHRFTSANGTIADFRDTGGGAQVNYITLGGATTGNSPTMSVANASDTNVNFRLLAKGTGYIDHASAIYNGSNIVMSGSNSPPVPSKSWLTLSGSYSGTITGGDASGALISFGADTVVAATGFVHGLNIQHNFGGAAVGSRTGLNVFLAQTSTTASKGNISGQLEYAGAVIESRGSANDGGAAGQGNAFGYVVGANIIARTMSGATYFGYLNGVEIDITAAPGTAPANKVGLKISAANGDGANGVLTDAAMVVSGGGGTVPAGFGTGIQFGQQDSHFPIPTGGTAIGTQLNSSGFSGQKRQPSLAYGIDFSLITHTTAFLNSGGFSVNGTGAVQSGAAVITPSASGASLDVKLQQSGAATVVAAGSGYYVNDVVFVLGGQYTVSSTNAGAGPGGITGLTILVPAYSASPPGGAQNLSGGSGTGPATATLTWTTPTGLSINPTGQHIGFNGTTPIAKPAFSGAKGGNAALASVIAALVAYGLGTDTTTA